MVYGEHESIMSFIRSTMIKHCQRVTRNRKIEMAGTPIWNARTGSLQTAFVLKTKGTRSVGKRKLRWFESVEEDLKKMGVRNWRSK
jgi:hypothetical protein